jgi:hypothetical protein
MEWTEARGGIYGPQARADFSASCRRARLEFDPFAPEAAEFKWGYLPVRGLSRLKRRGTHLDFSCRSRFVLAYSVAGNRLSNRPPPPPPGPYTPDPRDEILDRVSRGEITPDEAEGEAARLGLPPFAHTPDPAQFNPMSEPWWTLGMAAAWIIWRTPTAVRRVWSDYRRKVTVWLGPFYSRRYEGGYGYSHPVAVGDDGEPSENSIPGTVIVREYNLGRQSPLNLFDVLACAALKLPEDGEVVVEGSAAKNELWRLLQLGELVAEGIPADSGDRRTIRDAEWVDLDYFDQPVGYPMQLA